MALSRALAGVASVALVALGLLVLIPDCAHACSCGGGGASFRVLARGTDSSAVFSGEVVNFETPPTTTAEASGGKKWTVAGEGHATATLRVSEVWKGPKQQAVEITTASDEVLCGYPFEEEQEYLVYAYGKEQPFKVNLCSQTRQISKADSHLRVLGDGWRPKDEPLPDTSGEVARLGVLGLVAVVAVATAALFLLKRVFRSS